jgi:4-carboxymuconolactone decarboxylase
VTISAVRFDAHFGKASRKAGLLAAAAVSFALAAASLAHAQGSDTRSAASTLPGTRDDVRMVAPALERYAQGALFGDLWRRPDLAPRDRSLVTLSALIARNQAAEMPRYLDLALDSGVRPGEISEVVTHLAFYAGWGNAMAAVAAARDVFARRGIVADQLPTASPELLPIDQAAEARRAASVAQQVGPVAPGLEQFTTDVLFRDLWLRPGLAPRDRSLVTISALIASGQLAQLPGHLNRALDNGLTRAQASEAVTHLAFYAGWPNAFSAVPVVKGVFEGRPN